MLVGSGLACIPRAKYTISLGKSGLEEANVEEVALKDGGLEEVGVCDVWLEDDCPPGGLLR